MPVAEGLIGRRHPAEHVEGVDVTLEEGFLPSRGTDPVHGLARTGEPKAEQGAGYELAAQADGDVAEVNLDTTCPPRVPGATKICLRGA